MLAELQFYAFQNLIRYDLLNRRESDAEKEPEKEREKPKPKPETKYEDVDPKKYKCPDCGMKFVSERAMNIHSTTMHEKTEKDHKCVVCGKEYTSKQALDTHMKVFHGDYDPGKSLQDRVCNRKRCKSHTTGSKFCIGNLEHS